MKSSFALKKVVAPVNAGPQGLAPGQLPMGATLAINVRPQGSTQWTPAPPTIFARKGLVLQFQVVVQGGGAMAAQVQLGTAQWTGFGIGTGQTLSVNCSNVSANAAIPSVLTVSFGGQAATANIIVFELTPTFAFRDNFAGRSTTDIGVAEDVDLGFTVQPVGLTAAQLGGLTWRFKGNAVANLSTVGQFYAMVGTGAAANDGRARYRAPYATHGPGAMIPVSKTVELELAVDTGVSAGVGATKSFLVQKPVAHMKQQTGSAAHHWNPNTAANEEPSAGFTGVFYFFPKNVSFSNIGFREGTGAMESDGVCSGEEQGIIHQTTPTTFRLSTGNSATGCTPLNNVSDNIHSAAQAYKPRNLLTTNGGTRAPGTLLGSLRVGGKRWPITWEYTHVAIATGAFATTYVPMQKAYHEFAVYENGRATMHKGHKGCDECDADVSVEYGVGAAHNWP